MTWYNSLSRAFRTASIPNTYAREDEKEANNKYLKKSAGILLFWETHFYAFIPWRSPQCRWRWSWRDLRPSRWGLSWDSHRLSQGSTPAGPWTHHPLWWWSSSYCQSGASACTPRGEEGDIWLIATGRYILLLLMTYDPVAETFWRWIPLFVCVFSPLPCWSAQCLEGSCLSACWTRCTSRTHHHPFCPPLPHPK